MIIDLHGPINPGESNTVRIVMQVGEAAGLLEALDRCTHSTTADIRELAKGLARCVGEDLEL